MTTITRPCVPELDAILGVEHKVLDHGFIRVIDYMGDDAAVVQAARVSYGQGTKQVREDRALIHYLMRHRHTTPFEMCEIKFHIKLPIFVARQWIRHRTASVNEYSGRYSILDNEFYVPEPKHLAAQSKSNRQGRGDVLEGEEAAAVLHLLRCESLRAYDDYLMLLNDPLDGPNPHRQGLARELARMRLSLNFYTQWYWKIDLHNLLHFLSLRADDHAQYEIRAYAEVMLNIVKLWCPQVYEAFRKYRMDSVTVSASVLKIIQLLVHYSPVSDDMLEQEIKAHGISKREWEEIRSKLWQ